MTDDDRRVVIKRVARHEGTGPIRKGRFCLYADPVGKLTIGWGRNLEDRGLSKAEAVMLLQNDVTDAEADCVKAFPWWDSLDGTRQGVIVEMAFNMGLPALKTFTRTLAAVGRGDYQAAADQMLQSKWATQVGQRAVTLAAVMRDGVVVAS